MRTLIERENFLLHVLREQGVYITAKIEYDIRETIRGAHAAGQRSVGRSIPVRGPLERLTRVELEIIA